MDYHRKFKKECRIMAMIDDMLESCRSNNNPLLPEYEYLGKEYKKLFKQTKKLITISDRIQKELFDTRAELRRQYDLVNMQLSDAEEYVKSILPEPINSDKVRLSWEFIPSSKLGGDMLGYHWVDSENLAFYLIDVCSHGVGPALHSTSIINTLRFQTLPDTNFLYPEPVIHSLNNAFLMEYHNDMFFTMWYCVYNFKQRKLNYCGAGHPPLIILTRDSEPFYLESKNIMIGASKNYIFEDGSIVLDKDSCIYVYSDGAYEIEKRDGTYMSYREMADFLSGHCNPENTEIKELYEYLLSQTDEDVLDDDFTLIKLSV